MFHASHLPRPPYHPAPEERVGKENGILKSFKSATVVTAQLNGVLTGGLAWSLGQEFGLDHFFKLDDDLQAGSKIC